MKRKFQGIALAACLLLCPVMWAQAEEYTGGSGWKVEFTGEEMVSNFNSSDIADAVYALQPGDSVTISLSLANGSGRNTEWYMTNQVLSSLEDSSEDARGGAYTYRLSYKDSTGTESVLYSSESVGGEKETGAGLGLHEATDSLDEYFRLDALSPGAKGAVTLTVALDGETQGNAYQNTLADLQLTFAVDTLMQVSDDKDGSDPNGNPGSPGTGAMSYSTGIVKTGDSANLALWSAVAFVSGTLLLIIAVIWIKRRRKEEKS